MTDDAGGRDPLAVGLIGCGRVAEAAWLPAFALVPEARLCAVADPDPVRRQLVATQAAGGARPVASYSSGEELIGAAAVDAVVIATPADLHLRDAASAAAAGLPTLVEKPPAPDLTGAQALAALDPAPWIGFNRRFDPGAMSLRGALPVYEPIELTLVLRYRRASWGSVSVRDDALLDLGPHLVDRARWLTCAEPVEVQRARVQPDRAEIDLRLSRGRARIEVAADRPYEERVIARSPAGRLLASHRLGGPWAGIVARIPRPGRPSEPSALVVSMAGQLRALVDAVRSAGHADHPYGGPLGRAVDGVAAMAVLDAARSSASGGRTVPINLA